MITAIMIDNREPDFFQRLKFGGVPTMVTMLDSGDIQAVTDDGCTLVFERKTPSDFLNSLKDDRLFVQMARMSEMRTAQSNYWAYLVITGGLLPNGDNKIVADGRVTGWSFASVQGALLSIQEMGINITYCNGDMDFEDCILRIGKRDRKPEMRILPSRPATMLGPKIAFVSSLPGIGIEKAQDILDWAGNNVAHALIGLTDMEIKSPIGLATRRRLRDVLGLCEGENLEIVGTQITEPILKGQ
jgi:ERCC4-type nuclease